MSGERVGFLSSYRARLLGAYLLAVGVPAAIIVWALFVPLTDALLEGDESYLLGVARTATVAIAEANEPPEAIVESLEARTGVMLSMLASEEEGSDVGGTGRDPAGHPEVEAALSGETGVDVRPSESGDEDTMHVAVPVRIAGETVALVASSGVSDTLAEAARVRGYGLLLLVAALLVGLAVTLRATSRTIASLDELAASAHAMAEGELDAPIPDEPGELGAIARALEQLREGVRSQLLGLETEQRVLRRTLDGLEDAVLLLDGRTIALANTAAGRIFGSPPDGWRGREIIDTTIPAGLSERIVQRMGTAEAQTIDWGPDVEQRYLTATTIPLRRYDPAASTLLVIADVTERTLLDSVRTDFVSNASHELKTPAAGIQLLAESLDIAAEDGDLAQARHFASQLKSEAARLRQLVQDLLDLSRIESLSQADSVTDIRSAVDLAVKSHRPSARRRGLELREDISRVTGEDVLVWADPTDVAIALDNLLSNAVDYTEEGRITVALGAGADTVTIEVADTGIGIPAEDLPRVFERFYRVDRSRSRDEGGTGLGLSLVRHFVEKSGGTIDVSSVVDEGTAVTLMLPRAS